jgi:uncharacterized protein YcnI
MKHLKKISAIAGLCSLFAAGIASAHVAVRPDKAGVGAYTTFTVSVPSEKALDTVAVALTMPDGLNAVTPTVKPGWTVTRKTETRNGAEVVTAITWTAGKIPPHMRDDFTFSAQVPAAETKLLWKAYQTYSDGSLVAWDLGPNDPQPKTADGKNDFSRSGPGSQTSVVNDLAGTEHMNQMMADHKGDGAATTSLAVSMVALALSAAAIALARRR